MKPQRIQLRRTKGWRIPVNTVVVSRPSKWGNPLKVEGDRTAAEAELFFRKYLLVDRRGIRICAAAKKELRGKNLACWCPPGAPCHADVLLEVANR